MTSGYPSDATDNSVQASITSVGYSGASKAVPRQRVRSPSPAGNAWT
jgi:hypothetical protein